ncbi:S-DNA-T family DNA segregation ATPase FtsK/SpoIIIE [Motilibacter peucedani]|uniref:S-DNA-T family DNA segregation ATPase FtsK/SpoIIIE n=1 Tax=Motilibacter peucedani TaxID=598650 RepID=A0A420XSZ3_9ACTN|nr:FtsK/SpoIIIE domain-containing protein [Motilibacter peucedani]RKS79965.1 S-DNA-T family DNA segregation ATPase FtsK/SpoIIIE [Motilibacter peucedani]
MRITLTVSEPATRQRRDVLVEVAAGARAGEVLDAVAGLLGSPAPRAAWVDGRRVDPGADAGAAGLRDGCVLSLDAPDRWQEPSLATVDPAVTVRSATGEVQVTRPPRLPGPGRDDVFRLPPPPSAAAHRPFPLLVALTPLAGSVALALVAGSARFLLLGLLSPLSLLAGAWSERRGERGRARAAAAEHRELEARVRAAAAAAATEELARRRLGSPGPDELLATATAPGVRLWERRSGDPDLLELRVGTGELPAEVRIETGDPLGRRRVERPALRDAPVVVPLGRLGVVGLAAAGQGLADWVVAQAAVLHAPAALQVVVLTSGDGADRWAWTRWLPHLRPRLGQDAQALVAVGTKAAARRVGELSALMARRAQSTGSAVAAGVAREPDVMLVVDGARRLRSLPGLAALLREGPAHRISALCLESDERALPEECRAVVARCTDGSLRVSVAGAEPVVGVRADEVSAGWAEQVARALAPLVDATPDDDADLPGSLRLLDVLDAEAPGLGAARADAVRGLWRRTGGRSTRALLGVSLDGAFAVDLRRDGPHALVAGTTGSGKSELLQTLVASLAVANRPDALALVLVDYKGGAAFRECADLPHTAGLVTDLDGALVERALLSLRAELARRERVLAAAGARDLDDHVRRVAEGRATGPALPRLVIVVDEFAALARELPEFVAGLVDLAQRGRSLGISLVLATQRPSGCVSPEIRANASLRIALRVSDAAESSDVIDAPDAASVPRTTPGRGLARLGPGSLVPFQAARVGGRRDVPARTSPSAADSPLASLARPVEPPADRDDPCAGAPSDLALLVAAVRDAAAAEGVGAPPSPWLPPLPDVLPAGALRHSPGAYALADVPARQAQHPVVADLAVLHHLLVVGTARSGRTTALRAYAAALATAHPPSAVHLYALDCAGGGLQPLAALPHTGAVVDRSDPERAARLLDRLVEELRHRQRLLADGAGAAGELPRLVLLVDGWEGFTTSLGEHDSGRPGDALLVLLREGTAAGITAVVAGDRSTVGGRLGGLVAARLVLRLAEPSDYPLAGVPARAVPAGGPLPGRAVPVGVPGLDAPGTTVQLTACGDGTSSDQQRALEALAGSWPATHDRRPFRVDALPGRTTYAAARALRPHRPRHARDTGWALVGVGGDELSALGPELRAGPGTFVVAGPPRSGRSTALVTLARSLVDDGTPVGVVAPRGGPLARLALERGLGSLVGDGARAPGSGGALAALVAQLGPHGAVVVDDGELLRDAHCSEILGELVRGAADGGPALAVGGLAEELCSGFSGWQVELRRGGRGLLLSPQGLVDGDLVGVRVPRSLVGGRVEPGSGLLHLGDGTLQRVRVPAP